MIYLNKQLEQFKFGTLFFILFITINSAFSSLRDNEKGNGGDVLVCEDSVELLDKWEGEQRSLFTDLKGSTIRELVNDSLNDLKDYDYYNYKFVKKEADLLLNDIEKYEEGRTDLNVSIFEEVELRDIDDSLELILPIGCKKEQLVIQRGSVLPIDPKYLFRKDLWDRMDNVNKAMTILHESWYSHLIDLGAIDSRFTRLINSYMTSSKRKKGLLNYLEMLSFSTLLNSIIDYNILLPTLNQSAVYQTVDIDSLKEDLCFKVMKNYSFTVTNMDSTEKQRLELIQKLNTYSLKTRKSPRNRDFSEKYLCMDDNYNVSKLKEIHNVVLHDFIDDIEITKKIKLVTSRKVKTVEWGTLFLAKSADKRVSYTIENFINGEIQIKMNTDNQRLMHLKIGKKVKVKNVEDLLINKKGIIQ